MKRHEHALDSVFFRAGTLSDAPGIVALVESAYRGDSSREGWTTEADLLGGQRTDTEEIEEIIADPYSRFIVAHSDPGPDLIGCVLVKRETDTTAYVGMLAVSPAMQAHGLGRRLLEEAEKLAVGLFDAHEVRMTVIIQRKDLIEWYVRRGYELTPEREPFPYGNQRFGEPKRSDLEFVVMKKRLR